MFQSSMGFLSFFFFVERMLYINIHLHISKKNNIDERITEMAEEQFIRSRSQVEENHTEMNNEEEKTQKYMSKSIYTYLYIYTE